MQDSHIDKVRSSAVGKQLKQKKSNLQGQLHLPTLDLFWALWRVQHHSPLRRLDPQVSPGEIKSREVELG